MKKSNAKLNIITAICFAAAMLLTAYWLPNSEYSQMANYFLIAIWFSAVSYLNQRNRSNRNCFKKINSKL